MGGSGGAQGPGPERRSRGADKAGARSERPRPDSSRDSNATSHRAAVAHEDTLDCGALTHQPPPWSEPIRKRSVKFGSHPGGRPDGSTNRLEPPLGRGPLLRTVLDTLGQLMGAYGSDVLRSKRVPVACPIGRQTEGTHGHSRTARYVGSPADRQADPSRKPTF